MEPPPKTFLSIPKPLFNRAEMVAQHLNLSPSHMIELAIEDFIERWHSQNPSETASSSSGSPQQSPMTINQGDIYWVELTEMGEPPIPHPHVIVQENVLNHSRIHTVVACALTTNLKRASLPGNVLLEVGEANLDQTSVVEVSKVSALEKTRLGDYIGTLGAERINQIIAGMRFLQRSYESD